MAKFLVFLLLIATAVAVFSAPVEEEQIQQELEEHLRLARATCDLLSGFGVGDSACAVHCLAMKFKGGWCDKGVCHCRH
ncbi:sapecin-C-like isoform X1 [Cotesia glomerata]|uniref:Invertebrate defensins family profile domain-containing protein n=1 Tax=Cotesia glomerata TaxID=32391 RepID=A0AAV7ICH6_COTGL|nr:sapecin-C-like isoform X1 [Cotesia glomerata]KAH0548812.1 hypothetical protein KQX54_002562 [Cotesia glomerata]